MLFPLRRSLTTSLLVTKVQMIPVSGNDENNIFSIMLKGVKVLQYVDL